jgi:hypothetical protein
MGLLLPGKDEWVAYFRFAVMFVQSGGGGGGGGGLFAGMEK